jgi:uncharacterized protein DUF6886
MPPSLFHVSEEADIAVFHPRRTVIFPSLGPVVWALAESHLVNYLLPRDCPRITFCATDATTESDRERFNVTESSRVVVIGTDWVERVTFAALHLYEFPTTTFIHYDVSAGYWVSREAVLPLRAAIVADLPQQIRRRGADFRVVDHLRPLQEEIVASTLDYSIIRMRNVDK